MNTVIGQYVPGDSWIHRLDPRTKISVVFFFIIIIFMANNAYTYGLLSIFSLYAAFLTKIHPTFILKGLKPVWFLIAFTFILHLLVTKQGDVVFNLFGFKIYDEAIYQGVRISIRFFLLILMTSLLTLTTTPIEITDAIESMLRPLKKIKFPVHELALMMSISLRFIPTLMQEAEKISHAQASRGVDLASGPFRERLRAVVPLLIPLFVSAFKRAEELAMAMEARGYRGGEGRTSLRELVLKRNDYLSMLSLVILFIALFILRK
ncbi:energy-coupling factor transporter transmembrane protein EcfT [Bacillaceae bacterium S4-13-58]